MVTYCVLIDFWEQKFLTPHSLSSNYYAITNNWDLAFCGAVQ